MLAATALPTQIISLVNWAKDQLKVQTFSTANQTVKAHAVDMLGIPMAQYVGILRTGGNQ